MIKISTLAVILTLLAPGCMRHEYVMGTGAPAEGTPDLKKWNHHFLWGLVGKNKYNVNDTCPDGNALVKQRTTAANGVVQWLTGIIYSPTTVSIWCGSSDTAKVDEPEAPAEPPRTL